MFKCIICKEALYVYTSSYYEAPIWVHCNVGHSHKAQGPTLQEAQTLVCSLLAILYGVSISNPQFRNLKALADNLNSEVKKMWFY